MAAKVKDKLIASAISVFSEHGYMLGKVADIVKGADANIAAVNYHFGSKDNLFVHALRKTFAIADSEYPTNGNLPESASAEEKIKAIARAILWRSFDPGPAGDYNRIMSKTMYVPGSPIELILKEVRSMKSGYLEESLKGLLGTDSAPMIQLAKSNFFGLTTIISKSPTGTRGLFFENPTDEDISELIELQINVVLTSLKTLAAHVQKLKP